MNKLASLLLLAFCSAATACIATPYDGEIVANRPTTIVPRISGYGNAANQEVELFAKDPATGTFVSFTATTTGTRRFRFDDVDWFSWQLDEVNIPTRFWTDRPGGCGKQVTIKAEIGTWTATTFDQPFAECFDPTMSITELTETCGSERSPELTIKTCGALCC